MRIAQFPVPESPDILPYIAQVIIGIFIGSKITRDSIEHLKKMLLPGILIVVWALTVAFGLGTIVSNITSLNLYTSIMSCSMGGLPEMTVIALDTNADIAVVIIMQLFRMIITLIGFPLILKFLGFYGNGRECNEKSKVGRFIVKTVFYNASNVIFNIDSKMKQFINNVGSNVASKGFYSYINNCFNTNIKWGLYTLLIAACGGTLFSSIGIPAGAMVGSMVFIIIASLSGFKVKNPPFIVFELMLVGIGALVSENVSRDTIKILISGEILYPILICMSVIFISSIMMALIIRKITGWSYFVCFLGSAPAGLTAMTALSIEIGKDPFQISMMQLCRLIVLKSIVPFSFLFI